MTIFSVVATFVIVITIIATIFIFTVIAKRGKSIVSGGKEVFKSIIEQAKGETKTVQDNTDEVCTCEYCGSSYSEKLYKCPQCGASSKKKKSK